MDAQPIEISVKGRENVVPSNMDEQRKWFAVYTRSHHEKRIAQYYTERDIEHLLPIARVQREWSHYRKVTIELPLFPNYVFVHISRRERTRALEVPGALSLVARTGVPIPMADADIESLRASVALRNCEPHPYLATGITVRLNKGALAGQTGIVLRTRNSCRVVLTIPLLMRSFTVEVDTADLDFIV